MKLWFAVLLALAGCAGFQPRVVSIDARFDEAEARRLIGDGSATLKGNAFMRQQGGGVVTCAGSDVALVPATAYAKQRMEAIYGNTTGGIARNSVQFYPDEAGYYSLLRRARCDAAGNFQFERLQAGDFFVTTSVNWTVNYSQQGGNLMLRVRVRDGETQSVVLAP